MLISFENLPQAVEQLSQKLNSIENILLSKIDDSNAEVSQLLKIQQASEFLNLSVATLYGYVQRREIPHSKKGKHLYFLKSELSEWVKSGKKKTRIEIEREADEFLSAQKKK